MRNQILFAVMTVAFMQSVTACGGNPMNIAKDRDRADEKRKDAEEDNGRLTDENAYLKTIITHIIATPNHLWVLGTVVSAHSDAVKACAAIGFELPSSAQFAEFKTEVYDTNANWQKTSLDAFFLSDVPVDQVDRLGLALCRRDPTTAFIDDLDVSEAR